MLVWQECRDAPEHRQRVHHQALILCQLDHRAQVQQFLTSKTDDYENWKTRRILGIQPEGSSGWFFTIHMGWWNDEEEPFVDQWKCIQETLKDPKYREGTIWLMGDFNSQDDVRTSNVICNGKNAPVVSDHYGVMITV